MCSRKDFPPCIFREGNIMETSKQCSKCKITKDFSEFYKNKTKKYGYCSECKECSIKQSKKYKGKYVYPYVYKKRVFSDLEKTHQKLNRIKNVEKRKQWVKDNKTYLKLYLSNYRKTDIGKIVSSNSANKRRMFKLTTSDNTLTLNNIYPLTKELQDLLHGKKHKFNNCRCDIKDKKHLDHHIPLSKGGKHSLCNVVWLCNTCNLKKHNSLPNKPLIINML